jgi:hypothetical protein
MCAGVSIREIMDDKTYRGKLVVKVGPIKSQFSVVTLTEVSAAAIAGSVEGVTKPAHRRSRPVSAVC